MSISIRRQILVFALSAMALSLALAGCGGKKKKSQGGGDEKPAVVPKTQEQPNGSDDGGGGDGTVVIPDTPVDPGTDPTDPTPTFVRRVYYPTGFLALTTGQNAPAPDGAAAWQATRTNSKVFTATLILNTDYVLGNQQVQQ